MNEYMKDLCEEHEVNIYELKMRVMDKAEGKHPDCCLSSEECEIVRVALEIAAGI